MSRMMTLRAMMVSMLACCAATSHASCAPADSTATIERAALQDPQPQDPQPHEPVVQDPEPADPKLAEGAAAALEEALAMFKEAGLELDLEAKSITLPAEVGYPDQPLEYVLIQRRGKTHEAMFITEVKPSLLNAALLAIGLAPGENVRFVEKDPLPTREEVLAGAPMFDLTEPKGQPIWMTVSWKAKPDDGSESPATLSFVVDDLLIDRTPGTEVRGATWIYLGGHTAPLYRGEPPVFIGDYEGNLISNVYFDRPSHLVTIVHERAVDEQNWWFKDQIVPAPGTPVKFTIHTAKPKLVVEREQRLENEAKADKANGSEPESGDGKKQPQ